MKMLTIDIQSLVCLLLDGGGGNRTRVRKQINKGFYMFITGLKFRHFDSPVQDSQMTISSLDSQYVP